MSENGKKVANQQANKELTTKAHHNKAEENEVEEIEELSQEQVLSIVESILFATDRPQSLTLIAQAFKGTSITRVEIKEALDSLRKEYGERGRGITLEESPGGFQLRTKIENKPYLQRMVKAKTFKLSGPSLETLSIVAYKQPCIKATVDEIRGVESGHLLRALMDKGLVSFCGKSELPGKPMLYGTTKKFLEIFGLRNIRELPSLSEIEALLPEGMDEIEETKDTLSDLSQNLSEKSDESYSQGERELAQITDKLKNISTSSDFFEQEKKDMKAKRDEEKAQGLRESLSLNREISPREKRWLERYEEANSHRDTSPDDKDLTSSPSQENASPDDKDNLTFSSSPHKPCMDSSP